MPMKNLSVQNLDNSDRTTTLTPWVYEVVTDKPAKSEKQREIKTFPISHLKVVDDAQGIVEAITAVMGNVDLGLDVIANGAFTKTITERGNKIRVLDNHQTSSVVNVIGKVLSLREVSRDQLPSEVLRDFPEATGGLYVRTQFAITESEAARVAFNLIKSGYVDEWSIGYDPIVVDFEERIVNGKAQQVRVLREIRLWECSAVIWGMNSATATLTAKNAETTDTKEMVEAETEPRRMIRLGAVLRSSVHQTLSDWVNNVYRMGYLDDDQYAAFMDACETATDLYVSALPENVYDTEYYGYMSVDSNFDTKGAVGKQSFPLADRARRWNSQAAVRRCKSWAGGPDKEDISWFKYQRCFLWYDSEDTENFGAYKLPVVDIIDGSPHVIPRAVFAVAAVLEGARGGANIPDADKNSIRGTVNRYYAAMRSKFDDDSIVPPWKSTTLDTEQKNFYDEAVLAEVIEQTIEAYLERTNTEANTENITSVGEITLSDPNAISNTTTERTELNNNDETGATSTNEAGTDTTNPPTDDPAIDTPETLEQIEERRQQLLATLNELSEINNNDTEGT